MTKCFQCQIKKTERRKAIGLLHPLDIPNNKWESISMDIIVSLPRTQRGHDAIWVVVDRLRKLARFIPMKTTVISKQLAYQFVDDLFRFYGLPMDIISDRDSKFTSDFWTQVFKKVETHLSMSSTDHLMDKLSELIKSLRTCLELMWQKHPLHGNNTFLF